MTFDLTLNHTKIHTAMKVGGCFPLNWYSCIINPLWRSVGYFSQSKPQHRLWVTAHYYPYYLCICYKRVLQRNDQLIELNSKSGSKLMRWHMFSRVRDERRQGGMWGMLCDFQNYDTMRHILGSGIPSRHGHDLSRISYSCCLIAYKIWRCPELWVK